MKKIIIYFIVGLLFISGCKRATFVSPNGTKTTFVNGTIGPFDDNEMYDEYGHSKILGDYPLKW
jgi:hypothetical protein